MSAYQELVDTGWLGPVGVQMLREAARSVVRRYPAPMNRGFWEPDEIEELAHDVLVPQDHRPGLNAYLLTKATDDASMRKLTRTVLMNALADRSRGTAMAKLMKRVGQILAGDDRFVQVGGGHDMWTTAGVAAEQAERAGSMLPGPVPPHEDLLRAAWQVSDQVRVVRWRPDAARTSPLAERESLQTLLLAVLDAAGQPLERAAAARVLADFFGVVRGGPEVAYSPAELAVQGDRPAVQGRDVTGGEATSRELAAFVWGQLSDEERLVVPLLQEPVRSVAEALGWKRTHAHNVVTSTRTVIGRALGLPQDRSSPRRMEEPDGEPVGGLQLDLAEAAGVFDALVQLASVADGTRCEAAT